jgi:hypothetical protein
MPYRTAVQSTVFFCDALSGCFISDDSEIMGKGDIFHFMLHKGCRGDFRIVRGFDAYADGRQR